MVTHNTENYNMGISGMKHCVIAVILRSGFLLCGSITICYQFLEWYSAA